MTLADLAVIVATIVAWWSLIPQIRRLIRTGDPTGVSGTWPAIGLVSNAAWSAYLLSQQLWAAVPATTVMVVFMGVVLRTLHRAGLQLAAAAARGLVTAGALAVTYGAGSWDLLGFVLGWAYIPQLAPAVWAAYRTSRPTGVSVGTWALIGFEGILWWVYGALLDDTPVVIFGAVGVVAAVLILLRVGTTTGIRSRVASTRPSRRWRRRP